VQTGHPYDERHSRFERFAEAASNVTSRSVFFGFLFVLCCAWVWTVITEERHVERVLIGLFTIVTVLKISLLANSEKRHLEAIQRQQDEQRETLDELRAALHRANNVA
jgi:low affinity Fe/Cu permease